MKREPSKESKSRKMEAFFSHHTTCYRVEVIPTLYCGSHECIYVQFNKFTEEKIHQGPLTNVLNLAHKFLHNRLLEGYTKRNIICIYSYTVLLLVTVDHRSETEQPFSIIFQISYFHDLFKKFLRNKSYSIWSKNNVSPNSENKYLI